MRRGHIFSRGRPSARGSAFGTNVRVKWNVQLIRQTPAFLRVDELLLDFSVHALAFSIVDVRRSRVRYPALHRCLGSAR